MHISSFAVDLVVDEDVSSRSDGKFASCSFETVREHSIIALQMNKKKSEGLFLRDKLYVYSLSYTLLDHIESTSSLSTAVTLMTVIPNEAFSSTAPV